MSYQKNQMRKARNQTVNGITTKISSVRRHECFFLFLRATGKET
jgi:hypothetical protein